MLLRDSTKISRVKGTSTASGNHPKGENKMSAAAYGVSQISTGAVFMSQPQRLKPEDLADVIQKVQALRTITKTTGVYTSRRIGVLLDGLSTEDLVLVGKALQLKPREMPRRS